MSDEQFCIKILADEYFSIKISSGVAIFFIKFCLKIQLFYKILSDDNLIIKFCLKIKVFYKILCKDTIFFCLNINFFTKFCQIKVFCKHLFWLDIVYWKFHLMKNFLFKILSVINILSKHNFFLEKFCLIWIFFKNFVRCQYFYKYFSKNVFEILNI